MSSEASPIGSISSSYVNTYLGPVDDDPYQMILATSAPVAERRGDEKANIPDERLMCPPLCGASWGPGGELVYFNNFLGLNSKSGRQFETETNLSHTSNIDEPQNENESPPSAWAWSSMNAPDTEGTPGVARGEGGEGRLVAGGGGEESLEDGDLGGMFEDQDEEEGLDSLKTYRDLLNMVQKRASVVQNLSAWGTENDAHGSESVRDTKEDGIDIQDYYANHSSDEETETVDIGYGTSLLDSGITTGDVDISETSFSAGRGNLPGKRILVEIRGLNTHICIQSYSNLLPVSLEVSRNLVLKCPSSTTPTIMCSTAKNTLLQAGLKADASVLHLFQQLVSAEMGRVAAFGDIKWNQHPLFGALAKQLIQRYMRFGNVQMVSLLSSVIASFQAQFNVRPTPTDTCWTPRFLSQVHTCRMQYAEWLFRMGRIESRAELVKHDSAASGPNFLPRPMPSPLLICSICRVVVRGMAYVCGKCHHGGHVTHLRNWFQSGEYLCPVCGCECRKPTESLEHLLSSAI